MTQAEIEEIARRIWDSFSGEEKQEFRAATFSARIGFNAQIKIIKYRVPIRTEYENVIDIVYAIRDLAE